MQYALGLIETVGLAAAIQAADAALKSANVKLAAIENSKGNGRQTVFLIGDVASITAAVDAGINAEHVTGYVYASKVIAAPSDSLKKKLSKLNIVNFNEDDNKAEAINLEKKTETELGKAQEIKVEDQVTKATNHEIELKPVPETKKEATSEVKSKQEHVNRTRRPPGTTSTAKRTNNTNKTNHRK